MVCPISPISIQYNTALTIVKTNHLLNPKSCAEDLSISVNAILSLQLKLVRHSIINPFIAIEATACINPVNINRCASLSHRLIIILRLGNIMPRKMDGKVHRNPILSTRFSILRVIDNLNEGTTIILEKEIHVQSPDVFISVHSVRLYLSHTWMKSNSECMLKSASLDSLPLVYTLNLSSFCPLNCATKCKIVYFYIATIFKYLEYIASAF